MSENPSIPQWMVAVVGALSLAPSMPAQSELWPTRPAVAIPYVSYFGTAYLSGTPPPQRVLDAAKGDAERGWIVLHVSQSNSFYSDLYKGSTVTCQSTFNWRYRTGEITYFTTNDRIEVDGSRVTTHSSDPIGVPCGEYRSRCVWNDGSRTLLRTLSTQCRLVHLVDRPAKAEALHAWNPGTISVILPTRPESNDCGPTDRSARIVAGQATLPRKGECDLNLSVLGFVNETSRPEAPWTICLNQTVSGNTTRIADER